MNITKQAFKKASKITGQYKRQVNKSIIKPYVCICCKTNLIEPLKDTSVADGDMDANKQEQGCWKDGVVNLISGGYGSGHDMEAYYAGICDSCLSDLYKDGLIVPFKEVLKKLKKRY